MPNKQGMRYNVRFTFSVVDTTRAIYNEYGGWQVDLVTLNMVFSEAIGSSRSLSRATSHKRLRARDHTLQALSLVETMEPVQVRFTIRLRDQRSMRLQDGCKAYMDSHVASNGSCFMATWTIFKNHLMETCLTENRKTLALRMLTTVGLFYLTTCEYPHEQNKSLK